MNTVAAVVGTALTLNVAWPRGTADWYDRYSGFEFVIIALAVAVIYYLVGGRNAREAINRPFLHPQAAASDDGLAATAPSLGSEEGVV